MVKPSVRLLHELQIKTQDISVIRLDILAIDLSERHQSHVQSFHVYHVPQILV